MGSRKYVGYEPMAGNGVFACIRQSEPPRVAKTFWPRESTNH